MYLLEVDALAAGQMVLAHVKVALRRPQRVKVGLRKRRMASAKGYPDLLPNFFHVLEAYDLIRTVSPRPKRHRMQSLEIRHISFFNAPIPANPVAALLRGFPRKGDTSNAFRGYPLFDAIPNLV